MKKQMKKRKTPPVNYTSIKKREAVDNFRGEVHEKRFMCAMAAIKRLNEHPVLN